MIALLIVLLAALYLILASAVGRRLKGADEGPDYPGGPRVPGADSPPQ